MYTPPRHRMESDRLRAVAQTADAFVECLGGERRVAIYEKCRIIALQHKHNMHKHVQKEHSKCAQVRCGMHPFISFKWLLHPTGIASVQSAGNTLVLLPCVLQRNGPKPDGKDYAFNCATRMGGRNMASGPDTMRTLRKYWPKIEAILLLLGCKQQIYGKYHRWLISHRIGLWRPSRLFHHITLSTLLSALIAERRFSLSDWCNLIATGSTSMSLRIFMAG